jgi:hypothetical protein
VNRAFLGAASSQKAAAEIAARYLNVKVRSLLRTASQPVRCKATEGESVITGRGVKRKYKYVFYRTRTGTWEVVANRKFRGSAYTEEAAAAIAAKCLKLDISDLLLDSQPRNVRCRSDTKGVQESSFCKAEESPDEPKPEWRHTHHHQGRPAPSC